MTNKKCLIFAHYHSKGIIRADIIDFLKKSQKIFSEIIFVSTKIKKYEIKKISKKIKFIRRKNSGFDFCSYRNGWEYLDTKYNNDLSKKDIFFINSSILFIKPEKLLNAISKKVLSGKEFWGLSRSFELTDHIGTYCFFFSGILFRNKEIYNWWKNIEALDDHNKVVSKYELGLSKLMIKNNIKLCSVYKKNLKLKTNNILKKIVQRFNEIFFKTPKYYKKNPANYFWRDFYKKYGIIKIKLIKSNDSKYGIQKLHSLLKTKNLLKVALDN